MLLGVDPHPLGGTLPQSHQKTLGGQKTLEGGRGRTQGPHPHSRGWLKGDVTNENYIVSDLVSLC